nr:MAG: nonstructural protein [Microvirus sp.]
MILRVYAVMDRAVRAFNVPMTYRSDDEAARSFSEAVAQEGTQFNKYAADYSLFFLGLYDDNLGVFENASGGPALLLNGVNVGSKANLLVVDAE